MSHIPSTPGLSQLKFVVFWYITELQAGHTPYIIYTEYELGQGVRTKCCAELELIAGIQALYIYYVNVCMES